MNMIINGRAKKLAEQESKRKQREDVLKQFQVRSLLFLLFFF